MRKRAAGYSGRGRRNRPTSRHIPLASSMVGSLMTLLIIYIPISARKVTNFCGAPALLCVVDYYSMNVDTVKI